MSFWLIDSLCFLHILLGFLNAWHRTLFHTLRKLLLPITFYILIYVLQVNYFIYFLLFSGLASPKKQHIPLFYPPKLFLFPKCLHMQKQAPSKWALPLHLLQYTGLCDRAVPIAVIQLGKHGPRCWTTTLWVHTVLNSDSVEKAWILMVFCTATLPYN